MSIVSDLVHPGATAQHRPIAWIRKRLHEAANYRLRVAARGRFADACTPTSISLLMTERCHARCVHCDIWQCKGREKTPSVEQWKTFLSGLAAWLGPVQLTFTGGEALLRPETPALVEFAVSKGFFVELLTNGFWTDRSRLERAALADPWRITMSLDGIGQTHSLIRGRERFWEIASGSLDTLVQLRRDRSLHYEILLKTVIMRQNIDSLQEIAVYGQRIGAKVFYQPVENNYNAPDDPEWFKTSPNWPGDVERAVAQVRELARLKRQGVPIMNSYRQLEVMESYFRDPAGLQDRVQSHAAHEQQAICQALTTLQVQANGDIRICARRPPVGNIADGPIRHIWANRPQYWKGGCCLDREPNISVPDDDRIAVLR